MAGWLAGARDAGRAVAERADVWPAGALAAVAYLGWLPLVAVVAPTLRISQLVLFGAGLVSASLFPLNLLLIAVAAAAAIVAACGLAALGETAVLVGLSGRRAPGSGSTFAVVVVAVLPVAAATAALLAALTVVVPDALTSPDAGVALPMRLAAAIGPFLAVLIGVLLFCQAVGAAAIRRSADVGTGVGGALRLGLIDVLRHPTRRLGIAFVSGLLDLLAVAVAFVMLRSMWGPIANRLQAGHLLSPASLALVLGFVLVWLSVVLATGAAHAWISAWWSLELARDSREATA